MNQCIKSVTYQNMNKEMMHCFKMDAWMPVNV